MIPSKIIRCVIKFCSSLCSRTITDHPFQTVIWPQVSTFSGCIHHFCNLLSIWVFPYRSWFQMSFGSSCLLLGLYAKCASLLSERVISPTGRSLHPKPHSWQQKEISAFWTVPMIPSKSVLRGSLQKLGVIGAWPVSKRVCNFGVLVALLPLSLFSFCFCGVLLSEQSTELLTALGMCWLLNNHKQRHCAKFWFGVTVFSASRPWCSSREIKVFTDALWISTLVASPL